MSGYEKIIDRYSCVFDFARNDAGRKILIIGLCFINFTMTSFAFGDQKIKRPNVSGQFYSDDPKELSQQIDRFFNGAAVTPSERFIDIAIAPHAGYVYSGPAAAYSFKAVSGYPYKTIVILAPSHFVGFDGISIWAEGGFETPLGVVNVDQDFTKKLISFDENFYFYPTAFAKEHSLEVELPFLQKTFKDFRIVPVVMGQPTWAVLKKFASALHEVIGNRRDVLIVVSTDMSHYHEDSIARKMDNRTIEAIKKLSAEEIWRECPLRSTMEMCGFVPAAAALLYAREKGLNKIELLRYANSGDVTGEKDSVVGYSSFIIYKNDSDPKPSSAFTLEQKRRLMGIAKSAMEEYIHSGKKIEVKEQDPRLNEEQGAFVTLQKNGRLRGCIGNIFGRGPLYLTVRDMAIAAATQDPRFSPLSKDELSGIELEISVLSVPRVIKNIGEIQLGVHGVIVSQGPFHNGVFLPQVAAETHWSKEEFLSELCSQKAGLPADCWKDPKTRFEVFTAEVFSEKDIQ